MLAKKHSYFALMDVGSARDTEPIDCALTGCWGGSWKKDSRLWCWCFSRWLLHKASAWNNFLKQTGDLWAASILAQNMGRTMKLSRKEAMLLLLIGLPPLMLLDCKVRSVRNREMPWCNLKVYTYIQRWLWLIKRLHSIFYTRDAISHSLEGLLETKNLGVKPPLSIFVCTWR